MSDGNQPLDSLIKYLGGAVILAVFLWGVAKIIPAIGLAVGLAGAGIATGAVGGVAVASWIPTAAGVGGAAAAGSAALFVVHRVFLAAEKQRFAWAASVVALLAGVLTAVATEYVPANDWISVPIAKLGIGTVSAITVLTGSVMFRAPGLPAKVFGGFLNLGAPTAIIVGIVASGRQPKLAEDLAATPVMVWGGLAVVAGLCALLMWDALRKEA
jgi:hypothetical protein